MEIAERVVGDVMILDLNGKMTLGDGDGLLKNHVHKLIQRGPGKLILNLEAVPYLDSAGLSEIVRTHTTVKRQGAA